MSTNQTRAPEIEQNELVNYDELRKTDWVLDKILKGIDVRREIARQANSAVHLSDEQRRAVVGKMDAASAHGWKWIYDNEEAPRLRTENEALRGQRALLLAALIYLREAGPDALAARQMEIVQEALSKID